MKKKITWRNGMVITPNTFEQNDQYWQSVAVEIQRLAATVGYGLSPWCRNEYKVNIDGRNVQINITDVEAYTCRGAMFKLSGDYSVTLPVNVNDGDYYVVVQQDEYSEHEYDKDVYLEPNYKFEVVNLVNEDSIPLSKIRKAMGEWKVVEYIPPCVLMKSQQQLNSLVDQIRETVSSIFSVVEDGVDAASAIILTSLREELSCFGRDETPREYYKLLRKIAKSIGVLQIPDRDVLPAPEFKPYSNNDILIPLKEMLDFFIEYNEKVKIEKKIEPIPEPEEKKEVINYIDL